MSALFMKRFKRSEIAISRWKIIEQELSTFFAGFRKYIRVAAEPSNEASNCELCERWRVKVKHSAVGVILNLLEDRITRLHPMVVNIVECLVEAFHGDPFDHQSSQYYGGFKNAT